MTEEVLACPLINAVFTCILLPLSLFFSSLFCLHKVILYECFFLAFFKTIDVHVQDFQQFLTAVRTFFFLLGHVLGLSIICSESSDNGGCLDENTGEKSLHKFVEITTCAVTLLLLKKGVIYCQKTSKNSCQLISEIFRW